ncbi:MAG: hypothetical protein H7Y00_00900, partial [Fimbriimonadaceae bacterium]|nr:hypothetical protein [Chitinophagales bacterium]
MITEQQIPDILGTEYPALNAEFEKLARISSAYTTVQCFTDYTRNLLIRGNIEAAKKCFVTAEKLLQSGSNIIKNAVSNIFLFSISQFMDTSKANHEIMMQ